MNRVLFYVYSYLSRILKIFRIKDASMGLYAKALTLRGVVFKGNPRYIDYNTYVDPTGGITFGDNIVISTNVIILTHDYAYTVGLISIGKKPPTDIAVVAPVTIGDNCFIGAGSILLPGTKIGNNVIIGAGTVVKGTIADYSIVVGNPSRVISDTREWGEKNELRKGEFTLLVDKQ
jgi:acetyltransferase-like isoleucine patch superfamily enzyme